MLYSLLIVSSLVMARAHIVYICISNTENQLTVYGANYHSGWTDGGVIIAGNQFGNVCPVPYGGYPSTGNFGDVPCYTSKNRQAWSCGVARNWENERALTFKNVLSEAPNLNCQPVGNSFKKYRINSNGITWNKVTFPVESCGHGVFYSFSTTANNCRDAPFSNVWTTIECVPGRIIPEFIPNNGCPLNPTIVYHFHFNSTNVQISSKN